VGYPYKLMKKLREKKSSKSREDNNSDFKKDNNSDFKKEKDNDSGFKSWRSERPSSKSGERPSSRYGSKKTSRFSSRGKAEWPNNSNRRREDRRHEDGPVTMYKAVCDKCGAKCEVPFRPTPGKPILCNECFKKSGGKNHDMTLVHEKLDKIMKALKIE
jgi:CxxC-x17-CxxC domain-containing protein